jgi:hypothetical protein
VTQWSETEPTDQDEVGAQEAQAENVDQERGCCTFMLAMLSIVRKGA